MAHMNPRLELTPLDSILDAGVSNPALVAAIARQMQRIAGRKAAAALRQRRRAPMARLHLATFGYTKLVAITIRRADAGDADGGHRIRAAATRSASALSRRGSVEGVG